MRAADHAASTQPAAGAVGPLAAEERIGDRLAGLAEEHADGRLFVGVSDAPLLTELAQQLVGGVVVGILDEAEHLLRLRGVGRERALPVLQLRPLAVLGDSLT